MDKAAQGAGRTRRRATAGAALAVALAFPVAAQDSAGAANLVPAATAPRGPVARLVLAEDLLDAARQTGDGLAAAAAARLAAGLSLTEVARPPEGADPAAAAPPPAPLTGAAAMLEAAREAAAGDDLLLALIDQTAIDLQAGRTRLAVLRLSSLGLPAGGEARWLLPFYADAPAEIAALGPQGTTLELAVADAAGHPVCLESDPSPRAYCAFVPAQNGPFTVTLRNPGPAAAAVALVTN